MSKISFKEFRTILPYLSRYRRYYIIGFFCLVVVDAGQVIIPQFMRRAIDLIVSGNFTWQAILLYAGAMVGTMAVIALGRFLWRYFIHGSSRRIEAEMRDRLFEHLLTLSYDFYQKNKIGDLMARATNDLSAVRNALGMGLVALVDGTIMAASIIIIIFMEDARTAAFAVIPLPFITLLILLFGNLVGNKFRKAQETYSAMSDTVQETFAGIRVVKSFVKEWWFIKKFADTNDDYRRANMDLVKLYGFFFPLIEFLSGLTSLILLLAGGIRVVNSYMTAGELVALFRYFQMLIWPLIGAGFMVNLIQRGAVSLGRINEIMGIKPAIVSPENPYIPSSVPVPPPEKPVPAIEVRHLSFEYPGGASALKDVNLAIGQGEIVGILGRTGSGKSSLIKTFMRIIDPPPGTVRVFGVDVRDWDLSELRKLFSVSPQDSYLFSDSIKNNIAYGLEEGKTDEALIEKAAELSAIDRDLREFREGWDTLIGERGLTLSGGQKQRVAVARALTGRGEFLILDDSLSAVDAETEKRVLSGLMDERRERLRQGLHTTMIIISHRVSTLYHADKVLVLDGGGIAEYGSPDELINAGGFYARTAALQRLEEGPSRDVLSKEGGGV
ncbi:MAG: ABC transporter ATP-binding protein/permease [Treponema sp.]|jgi:ATP-binding cassette subfamily B protein|nr:ABC transporter ATP-binding protein/permease [Treponema sp.]